MSIAKAPTQLRWMATLCSLSGAIGFIAPMIDRWYEALGMSVAPIGLSLLVQLELLAVAIIANLLHAYVMRQMQKPDRRNYDFYTSIMMAIYLCTCSGWWNLL